MPDPVRFAEQRILPSRRSKRLDEQIDHENRRGPGDDRHAVFGVAACRSCACRHVPIRPRPTRDAAKLHALFDQEWQWTLREYPEFATGVGDNRYNDKLTDLSAPAMDRRKAHEREYLRRLREIDRGRLTGQDVVSYDLSLAGALQDVAMQRFPAGKIPLGGRMADLL